MPDTVWRIMAWMFVIGSWYAFVLLVRDVYRFIKKAIFEYRLERSRKRWVISEGFNRKDLEIEPGTGETYSD
jgi:hypothetical protein